MTLELIYAARDAGEINTLASEQALLREIPVSASVQRAAKRALRELAAASAGQHRVPLADTLIAAAAQEAGVDVLHYDHHYNRLATILSFKSIWLAKPGTID